MRNYFILLLLLFNTLKAFGQLYTTDFEAHSLGLPYTRSLWQSDGFIPNNWDNGLNVRSAVDSSYHVSGSKSLRIEFPKNQFSNATADGTGVQVELLLEPRNEYYMSYFLRFSDNFSWGGTSEGGKLPGLTNRNRCGSDFICDGTDGFSARFMWRKNGKGVLYLYHADMPQPYGQDFAFKNGAGEDFLFEKGKWYHIAEYVKNNTSSTEKDGIVQVWINGNEVLYLDTIRFQTNGDQIDNFFMSTFHGGNSMAWAPTDTCYIWFDDLKVSTSLSDVSYEPCSNPDAAYFGENCVITSFTGGDSSGISQWIPNPVHDVIELDKEYESIKVFDWQGKPVLSLRNSQTIHLGNCSNGMYILVLQDGMSVRRQKVLKNTVFIGE